MLFRIKEQRTSTEIRTQYCENILNDEPGCIDECEPSL